MHTDVDAIKREIAILNSKFVSYVTHIVDMSDIESNAAGFGCSLSKLNAIEDALKKLRADIADVDGDW